MSGSQKGKEQNPGAVGGYEELGNSPGEGADHGGELCFAAKEKGAWMQLQFLKAQLNETEAHAGNVKMRKA